jgi:peptide chain release factor 3
VRFFSTLSTGNFKKFTGDTLTEGEIMSFKGTPKFLSEHFRYINNAAPNESETARQR